jgi:hypothetical protein
VYISRLDRRSSNSASLLSDISAFEDVTGFNVLGDIIEVISCRKVKTVDSANCDCNLDVWERLASLFHHVEPVFNGLHSLSQSVCLIYISVKR